MRLTFLFFFSSLLFKSNAQTFNLLIGTYTGSGSKGIYVYRFNATNGKSTWVSNTDTAVNPSYLALSKSEKYLYSVNETGGDNPGRISSFAYDKASGKLRFINSQLTGGDHPCYVSVSADNKWVAVANYSGGSVSVFPVNEDGSLQPYAQLINHTGSGANKARQEKPHVHSAVFSPDEHFLYTPDLGTDKVMVYKFNPLAEKLLIPANPPSAKVLPGDGPRHFTFHPNQKFAYVVGELTGTVSVYKYYKGNLQFIQRVIAHPVTYKGDIGSADIHLSPDGKFLYVSNRGDENNIAIFSTDPVTGKLTLRGYQPVLGKTPRNFLIDPTGNFLLVANQNTNNIVVFKRNKNTGLLKFTGSQINVPKPVCLKMTK